MEAFGRVEPIRAPAVATIDVGTDRRPNAETSRSPATPSRRSPRINSRQNTGLGASGDIASPATVETNAGTGRSPTTPSRRSPRIEAMQNQPPTARQLERIETEEAFTRRVSPRVAGATTVPPSSAAPRTRSVSRAIRERGSKRQVSPHVEVRGDGRDGEGSDQDADQDEDMEADEDEEDEEEEATEEDDDEEDVEDVEDAPRRGELLVELSPTPVRVPAMVKVHRDWEAFKEYLAAYSQETHQVIVIFEVMSVDEKNRRISKAKTTQPLIDSRLNPYARVYKCTHGPKPKNRGRGVRPRRFIRYTECPFRFRVQWTQSKTQGWVLMVTPTVWFHNHAVGEGSYGTYPVARGLHDPAAAARAREMVKDGVRRAVIYDRMLDMGQNVFKTGIDNFVSSQQSRATHREEDDAPASAIGTFVKENPDGVLTVDENERGEARIISVTTSHMRNMFARFGELMLVDCTHKTNRFNYQLCTFMVMDEYGSGQVVQQSLLETNGDWHMERALLHLKRANPDSWKLVRVIVVDKDLNEVRVLKRMFGEEVSILLCHFHFVKYLQLAAHKPEFGKLTKGDYTTIDHLCHNLVYSASEVDYADNRAAFLLSCQRLSFSTFADYVHDNWFSCPEMWVMYLRAKLPHFRNHTNNRVESWFGKFKEGVDENSSVTDCFEALLSSARRCEKDYQFATKRVGRYHNANYDEEMEGVLLCSTPFVAEAVLGQYTAALNKFEDYTFDHAEADHFVLVKGKHHDHVVDTTDWTCDCEFSKSMRLPCRHAMAWRRSRGERVIPLRAIDVRWQRAATAPVPVQTFKFNRGIPTNDSVDVVLRNAELSTPQARFNNAMCVLKPICSELSDIEDPQEFRAFVEFLLAQFGNVRQRKRIGILAGSCDAESPKSTSQEPFQLSQANNLYSAEVGDVPAPCLDTLRMAQPIPLVCNDVQDEQELYSEHAKESASKHSVVDAEMGSERNDDSSHASGSETETKLRIKVNQKAKKTGRPKKAKAAEVAVQRQDRARFNAFERGRLLRGGLTMQQVISELEAEKPVCANKRSVCPASTSGTTM